ncbi:MAG: hypothetical protein AB7F89_17615 [Pirellulaceae bacterium]
MIMSWNSSSYDVALGRRRLLLGAVGAVLAWPVSIFATGGSLKGLQAVIRRSSPLRGQGLVWILREDD